MPDALILGSGLVGTSVVGAALTFGFRHGVDWDHIAAIGDLTTGQTSRRRSLHLATVYALGHAGVVAVLGTAAILFGEQLPDPVDAVLERVVGLTLLALGAYVAWALVRHRGAAPPQSRWMLVLRALKRARARLRPTPREELLVIEHEHAHDHRAGHVHEHTHDDIEDDTAPSRVKVHHQHAHRHVATMPADPFAPAGVGAACAIGMLHGVGAETPTQVLILATAANAGGSAAGIGVLACFIVGLLCANTLVAIAAAYGYVGASANRWLMISLSVLTASFSLVVGTLLVTGHGTTLPALLGG
jgi:high-affinity nickel-transport protein